MVAQSHIKDFEYNSAIVRTPSEAAATGLTLTAKPKMNIAAAFQEFRYQVNVLRSVGLNVYEVPADEKYPDCVFIEDPMIIRNDKALFLQMGAATRRGENAGVRNFVEKNFPNITVYNYEDESAHLEGGDMVFVGGAAKEILVGVGERSNLAGVAQMQKCFSDYTITPIKMPAPKNGGLLHMGTMTQMAAPGMLTIGKSPAAQCLKREILKAAVNSDLEFFQVEDDWAANCILVNGYVLHCDKEEFPKSYAQFQDRFGDSGIPLTNKEFEKIDGSLTCRVRLFNYHT